MLLLQSQIADYNAQLAQQQQLAQHIDILLQLQTDCAALDSSY